MKIEIGKCYNVSNLYKKTFVELNFFYNNETKQYVTQEVGWRGGNVRITPVDEDEVDMLQYALDDGHDLEPTAFQEFEFIDSWDGCWEEYRITGDGDSEWLDELYEKFCDDEELSDQYFGFDSYLEEELGLERGDYEIYITDGVEVELVENPDVYVTVEESAE